MNTVPEKITKDDHGFGEKRMISGLEKITKDDHGFGEKRIISGL